MRGDYFFDLRNIYPKEHVLEKGFKYISIRRWFLYLCNSNY